MESGISVGRRVWRITWGVAMVATIFFWAYLYVMKTVFYTRDPWTWELNKDPWTMKSCDRRARDVEKSPGGQWQAMTVDFACDSLGGGGYWTAIAIVKSDRQPSAGDAVLYASGIYNRLTHLEWQGDRRLKITLPDRPSISTQTILHDSIVIDVQINTQ